jgi:hypothetical protein
MKVTWQGAGKVLGCSRPFAPAFATCSSAPTRFDFEILPSIKVWLKVISLFHTFPEGLPKPASPML